MSGGEEPDRIGAAFGAVVRVLARRRGMALAGVAILTAGLAWFGSGLVLDEDIAAFLPTDEPAIAAQARALKAFRGLDLLRIDLGPAPDAATGPADRERLRAGVAALERVLEVSPLVSRVVARVAPEIGVSLAELSSRSLPVLVPTEQVAAIASRYERDEEVDALLDRHLGTLLGLEGTVYAQKVIARDPLGFEGAFFEKLRELQAVAPGARLDGDRIVSADGRHALVLVEPAIPSSKTEEAARVLALVDEGARAANEAADRAGPGAPLRTLAAGGHRAGLENARAIKRDAQLSSVVSLAAMLLVYALVFPRRWLIPLTALPLVFGGVVGAAACRLLLGKISAIAVGFGGVLLGLADDFIVHLYWFFEVRARDGHPEPAVAAVRRIAAPTLAAGAAIAAAFGALAASGFPGQRDLAVFAATSLFGTLLFCLVVHPLILPGGRSTRPIPDAGRPVRAFLAWSERNERPILAFVVLATIALGALATRLRFEDDPRAIELRSPEARAAERELADRWGDPSSFALVVATGADLDAALAQNEAAYAWLERARARGEVRAVSSIAPVAPSRATQETRRAAWHELWTEERRARISDRLARLGPRHRFSARAFAPFAVRLEGAGEAVDVPSLASGPLRDLVGRRIARDPRGSLVLTVVTLASEGSLDWASALERDTGAIVATGRGFARALVATLGKKLRACGLLALAVVLAILVPALRRPRLVAAAVLPLVVGLVWSAGLFALFGTTINAINFLVPVLTFGLNVDYVLFLASGYVSGEGGHDSAEEVEQARGAVVASASTTLSGMASLLLAQHPALWSVGTVALVGTSASLVAIFLITPALLRPRK